MFFITCIIALLAFLVLTSSACLLQYRTGRTLGSGTYAIVKEAIHIKTGKYYACKVINKKLMEGREHMVSMDTLFCFVSFSCATAAAASCI